MTEQNQYKWMVCVRCFTFNQAHYIVDAMNGFTMQQTDFPFVCTIVDDASTDGEQDVINQYLKDNFDLVDKSVVRNEETDDYVLTFAQHKTNKNCFFAVIYLKYNHYSIKKTKMPYISEWNDNAKYIALCEGDDYWVLANKLYMQYDYMEKHELCGLCHAKAKVYIQQNKMFSKEFLGDKQADLNSLLIHNRVSTLTAFYRTAAAKGYYELTSGQNWLMSDRPLWIYISNKYELHFFPLVFGVYRLLQDSAMRRKSLESRIEFLESSKDMALFFAKRYASDIIPIIKENHKHTLFITAYYYCRYKRAVEYYADLDKPSLKEKIIYRYCQVASLFKRK